MDGVSEDFDDFSGLPEYKSRRDRNAERVDRRWKKHRANPHRGRLAKIALIGAFLAALVLGGIYLIVAFAPAPYMSMSAAALSKSVGDTTAAGCRPDTGGWICPTAIDGKNARYRVSSDVFGCWNGKRIGGSAAAPKSISGCVTLMDHLTAK